MKSGMTKGCVMGAVALISWGATVAAVALSILYSDEYHWRGLTIFGASLAVTFSLAWLIRWMMPSSSDSYAAGYRAGEQAGSQREAQRAYGVVLGGRTGTTSVIPIRPVRPLNR